MKTYTPAIRLVSANHDKTIEGANALHHAMRQHGLTYPVLEVFCHLETSRCGLSADAIGIEVDGAFIFVGKAVTEKVAEAFCTWLPTFVEKQKKEFGRA